MGTTADKLEYLQGTKAAIKQAIVNKGVAVPDGTTFRAYAEKIGDIIDVPDLSNPGAASDLRSGKQLVGADGSIVTGTLPEVIQATPTISVSSSGLITASATQSGGIVAAGSKSATKQLPTQAAKTVTPGTTNQTAVASGRYTTGAVTVKGDANLKAENIAEGVSIFGVMGTHSATANGPGPLLAGPYANLGEVYDDRHDPRYMLVSTYIDIPSNLPGGEGGGFGLITIDAPNVYQVLSQYMLYMLPIGIDYTSVEINFLDASNTRTFAIGILDSYSFYINDITNDGWAYVYLTDGSVEYQGFSSKISYQIYVVLEN